MGFFDSSSRSFTTAPDWVRGNMESAVNRYAGMRPEEFGGPVNAELDPMLSEAWANLFASDDQRGALSGMQDLAGMGIDATGDLRSYINALQTSGPNTFDYDQGTFDTSFGNLSGGIQDAFDLGSRQIQQGFDWNLLPNLNMDAALSGGSGNTGAFRAGALGQAMTDQNIRQLGSDLYMNAANRADANAMTGGRANLGAAESNTSRILAGLSDISGLAMPALTGGFNMAQGIGQNQLTAGNQAQLFDQNALDRERNQFYFDDDRALNFGRSQALDLSNIGSTFATRKASQSPSGLQNLGDVVTIGASLMGLFPGGGAAGGTPGSLPVGSLYNPGEFNAALMNDFVMPDPFTPNSFVGGF